MDIKKLNQVYNQNKLLDTMFAKVYGNSIDIIEKNKLELLVELGELANESKCFKYWSKKEANRELVLEEYADTLLMVFYFFNQFNISLDEEFPRENNYDIVNEFMDLFNLISRLKDEYTKDLIKEIFVNMLRLGTLLGFSIDEIIESSLKKIKIDMKRFEIDY